MLFPANEPHKAYICEAAWDVITSKKMISPGEEMINKYKDMDGMEFMSLLTKMDRLVKKDVKDPSRNINHMTSIMGL